MNGLGTRWQLERRTRDEFPAVPPRYQRFVTRLFRWLQRWGRFRQTLWQGVLDFRKPPAQARDSGPTPAKYQELASSLALPDRPMPLTRFERAVPDEAILIRRMARLAAHAVIDNFCDLKSSDVSACAMRDQHAKSHGCVRAQFVVRDDLPAEFTTPLFRPGARHPAIVRFSNGNGKPQGDAKLDGRGLSIKLREVEGETFLRGLVPEKTPPGEHDFLFSSFPVFFCKNAIDYTDFMAAVSAPHGTWREKLVWLARWFWFAVRYPRQFITFFRVGFVRITNPLTATYHSMSPYLFGDDKVVRYLVAPVPQEQDDAPGLGFLDWLKSENFLRNALVRGLRPDAAGGDVVLDFSVRVRHSATAQDAEDASLWWTRPLDRTVSLARILIPRQDFQMPDRLFDCENMMFSPWNCLPEHQPLGSINRMRLAVYLASLQVRRKLNMVRS